MSIINRRINVAIFIIAFMIIGVQSAAALPITWELHNLHMSMESSDDTANVTGSYVFDEDNPMPAFTWSITTESDPGTRPPPHPYPEVFPGFIYEQLSEWNCWTEPEGGCDFNTGTITATSLFFGQTTGSEEFGRFWLNLAAPMTNAAVDGTRIEIASALEVFIRTSVDPDYMYTYRTNDTRFPAWGEARVAPVPEPATWLLLGTGLVGLLGFGRKKLFKK